ncbi:S1 family peptidase [Streptomyces sp. AJS327]|uniref:S1 family peptidase n=1 Tax=Streptomyces sp. AJS327 TaxID=2545265 RepID=UPI0021557AF8|nr:S1 family peptidase [Streptomyces sp. AJS327]
MLLAGAGVAALAAGTLTVSSANATDESPSVKTLSSTSASSLAEKLSGKGTAGAYYDAKAEKLVVNVVSDAAKEKVESAGAEAKEVRHSMAELTSTMDAFGGKDRVVGTSRAVDAKTNKVVITADKTVKGAKLAELKKQVAAQDGKAELQRTNGKYTTKIAGGDAIWGDGGRCSLGFNVTVGGEAGFLTAGHCTDAISSWAEEEGGPEIAATKEGSFPGDDYGIAMYTADTEHPSEVNLYDGGTQAIAGAGEATEGQQVTRSGSTTQVHDGQVLAVDATVEYPEGTVEGLIHTDVCAEPGDSGGALFAEDQALGMTSGGSGSCSAGGETFFQPVTEALEAYGAEIG